jgi:hypothetical protein
MRKKKKKPEGRRPREERGRIIIKRILAKIVWEIVDWMRLAQVMNQWWVPGNMVMNLRVP